MSLNTDLPAVKSFLDQILLTDFSDESSNRVELVLKSLKPLEKLFYIGRNDISIHADPENYIVIAIQKEHGHTFNLGEMIDDLLKDQKQEKWIFKDTEEFSSVNYYDDGSEKKFLLCKPKKFPILIEERIENDHQEGNFYMKTIIYIDPYNRSSLDLFNSIKCNYIESQTKNYFDNFIRNINKLENDQALQFFHKMMRLPEMDKLNALLEKETLLLSVDAIKNQSPGLAI